jgi:hypothetical protein
MVVFEQSNTNITLRLEDDPTDIFKINSTPKFNLF